MPSFAASSRQQQIVIGAKNFEEQYILADLIGDRLARAGIATTQKSDLGSAVALRAMAAGDIDVYVDYSGTLWAYAMHRRDMPGPRQMLDQLRDWLGRNEGITLLGSLGFENAYVFAMRADRAKALGIESLADLAAHAGTLKIGGDFEIFSRPEWTAASRIYGISFAVKRQYQPDFLYHAVVDGDVDVISAFSSDGRIARYGLKLLSDPRGALPPYDAVLLLGPRHRNDDAIRAALRPLIGAIPLARMQQANLMVDRPEDRKTPAETAVWLDRQIPH